MLAAQITQIAAFVMTFAPSPQEAFPVAGRSIAHPGDRRPTVLGIVLLKVCK
jgi:hypothetical protein